MYNTEFRVEEQRNIPNVMHFIYYITFTLLKLHPIVHLKKYKWAKLTDIANMGKS